jgi:hypothetical protein
MVEHILALFPRLRRDSFRVTSEPGSVYNCIAWSAGVTDDWWWPLQDPEESYGPEGVARVRTLEAFREAFARLGFSSCEDEQRESGWEKIALFAHAIGTPTHAARQLPSGRWTSKLGKAEDIEHALRDLEGDLYGAVVLMMKRQGSPPGPAVHARFLRPRDRLETQANASARKRLKLYEKNKPCREQHAWPLAGI